ncbi:MAG: PEP-CTERM sorting domain-containing protein, partial [Planctomycetaceae bacterium]
DGSNPELFLSGVSNVYDLEIDSTENKLYFTSATKLGRVNLNGTGYEEMLSLSGERFGKGLALALESEPVPEPSSVVLLIFGMLISGMERLMRRKKRHNGHVSDVI